jgi:glucosyl-dolichyl phosphate glucuronosyltransferase
MDAKPLVSVVIASRNRVRLLTRTLEALAIQDYPQERFEVLVADNGSTDATAAVVQAIARQRNGCAVRYLQVTEPGKSRAVNAALREVRGSIVAFTDDDVRPARTWVARLARALEERDVDFVAGRVLPEWEIDPPRWMSPALFGVLAIPDGGSLRLRIERGVNDHIMPIGANMAVRADVLQRVGGLREDLGKLEGTLRTGEDHEFFLRLIHHGFRGLYEPEAVVCHWVPRHRLNRAYFRRWLYQNGRDVARLQDAYPRSGRRLFRVPLYLWRDAVTSAFTTLTAAATRDHRRRFAASLRLIWLAGYASHAWLARSADVSAPAVSSQTREGAVSVV